MTEADQEEKARDYLTGRCGCKTCRTWAEIRHPLKVIAMDEAAGLPLTQALQVAREEDAARRAVAAKTWRPPWAVLGVDLGKRTDFSGLVLAIPAHPSDREGARFRVPTVHRIPLGFTYRKLGKVIARTVAGTRDLIAPGGIVHVMVDATGVGDAACETIAEELPDKGNGQRVRMTEVVITAGRNVTRHGRRLHVAKVQLVSPAQDALEKRELLLDPSPHRDVLERELRSYVIKASSIEGGADRLEAEKQSDHDDLVMALCMAMLQARGQSRSSARILNPGRSTRRLLDNAAPASALTRARIPREGRPGTGGIRRYN